MPNEVQHNNLSKLVYEGQTLFDLTSDTVTPENLISGYTAHDEFGDAIVGTATSATLLRYNSLTNWNAATDVIPEEGELIMAYEVDTNGVTNYLLKVGDGINNFADLPYYRPYNIQVLDHVPTASETNNKTITFVT